MTNEWMIDVLADLRNFAAKQAMLELAEHLDDAILVATVEIRDHDRGRVIGVGVNDAKAGNISGTVGNNQYS
ncbi:MAG: hypothetical protein JKY41_15695 [Rhodobacteraceae bacterium]|nr:hypothetical protein [Paracoccaceae bacterium]